MLMGVSTLWSLSEQQEGWTMNDTRRDDLIKCRVDWWGNVDTVSADV